MSTHKRTLVKMITYRITAWLTTIPITYLITGNFKDALESSTIVHIVLSFDYYIHERIWLKIKWGKTIDEN